MKNCNNLFCLKYEYIVAFKQMNILNYLNKLEFLTTQQKA